MRGRWFLLCFASAIALSTTQGKAQPLEASEVREEVVVTARRREERLVEVPISVTALSGEALEAQGISDVTQLQYAAPSLGVANNSSGREDIAFAIRGVRTGDRLILTNPPVGLYFAEVNVPRTPGFGLVLFDLESVQVLKGVQGTLFGRNTTGGAVLIEPHHPTDEFEGEVRFEAGNFSRLSGYGMVNLPVVRDKVSLRLAGKVMRRDGFTVDRLSGLDQDDETFEAGRASIALTPTDNLESLFIFDILNSHTNGTGGVLTAANFAPGALPSFYSPAFGLPDLATAFAQQQLLGSRTLAGSALNLTAPSLNAWIGRQPYADVDNWGITNKTTIELGDITIKNVASYRDLEYARLTDFYGVPIQVVHSDTLTTSETISEELQLQGRSFDDRLTWVVGGYYFREEGIDETNKIVLPAIKKLFGGFLQSTPNANFVERDFVEGAAKTISAFASATFALTDDVKFTQGIRWTQDKKEGAVGYFTATGTSPTLVCGLAAPQPADCLFRSGSRKWQHVTWDATLQYLPSPNSNYYVAVRHGYNGGGFSLNNVSSIQLGVPFNNEKINEYEIGAKNVWSLNDVTFRANAAVFYQSYTDKQTETVVAIGTSVTTVTGNTGSEKHYGGELELGLSFPWGLDVDASYSYVNVSNVKNGIPGGFALVGAPKNQAAVNAAYRFPLDERFGNVVLNINGSYRSLNHLDEKDKVADQPAFFLANARLDWNEVMGSGFGLALFATNLFDKEYRAGTVSLQPELGLTEMIFGQPRMFGGEVSYKF